MENARPLVFRWKSGGKADRGAPAGEHRPGFRVVHYSVQDDHAHFLVEADDKLCLANGVKSLGARFARCVNPVYRRTGRVLATRFHHVAKRTPTEVRNALAY
ncbi:MAG: transposase, partial [Gammaproteobacteria bacterium]|nr:transposase [Gammaproteobacteria bacterium]